MTKWIKNTRPDYMLLIRDLLQLLGHKRNEREGIEKDITCK